MSSTVTFWRACPRPATWHCATWRLWGATALMHMDLAVAFPLVDVLLGGEGKVSVPAREITEIEDQILETIMRILCRELQIAWQSLALEFQFDQRQKPEPAQRLMHT